MAKAGFPQGVLVMFLLGAVSLAVGLWLMSSHQLSLPIASDFPTATQTVKFCKGPGCSYLTPDDAFKLNLGVVLSAVGLAMVGGAIFLRRRTRSAG